MNDPHQSMTVTINREGDTAHIALVGELDLHSAADLAAATTQVLADSPRAIAIDARGLSFADSAGLRALLVARNDAEANGVSLRVSHVSDALDRLLEMTGLREALDAPAG